MVSCLKKLDLEKFQELSKKLRGRARPRPHVRVIVHMGTCGIASGSGEVLKAIMDCVDEPGTEGVAVTTSGCAGFCSREPMVTVEVAGSAPVKYGDINPDKARKVFAEHVLGGKPVAGYVLAVGCESTY
jgi:NADP-reducing hydrogenase subunit HndB